VDAADQLEAGTQVKDQQRVAVDVGDIEQLRAVRREPDRPDPGAGPAEPLQRARVVDLEHPLAPAQHRDLRAAVEQRDGRRLAARSHGRAVPSHQQVPHAVDGKLAARLHVEHGTGGRGQLRRAHRPAPGEQQQGEGER
jgi:hypothetical protein